MAAAGNDHLRIGASGRVVSHGPLTPPGTAPADFFDYFGLYEVPGGVPGVVDVSATNNRVVPSSRTCPPGTEGVPTDPNSPICKPLSDPHQAAGQGQKDQLSYYSNYGPRIDIAAPGGARKFSSGFPPGQCYSTIQGTSMATPHVSAALALIASAHPSLRKHPDALVARLKATANTGVHNYTEAVSATDTSGGDLTDATCPTGYCHLGGARISDRDAYGAGLVNAANP